MDKMDAHHSAGPEVLRSLMRWWDIGYGNID
jgi:hypothetical protein